MANAWQARFEEPDDAPEPIEMQVRRFLETPVDGRYQSLLLAEHTKRCAPDYRESRVNNMRDSLTDYVSWAKKQYDITGVFEERLHALLNENLDYFKNVPPLAPPQDCETYGDILKLAMWNRTARSARKEKRLDVNETIRSIICEAKPELALTQSTLRADEAIAAGDDANSSKHLNLLIHALETMAKPGIAEAEKISAKKMIAQHGDAILKEAGETHYASLMQHMQHILTDLLRKMDELPEPEGKELGARISQVSERLLKDDISPETKLKIVLELVRDSDLMSEDILGGTEKDCRFCIALVRVLTDMRKSLMPITEQLNGPAKDL